MNIWPWKLLPALLCHFFKKKILKKEDTVPTKL